uniref:(northern house mosquito) hypothetical protein n=1 Tax=Culex pipiens TaxID=7175 RepID=A0A8D8MX44_CULPI
MTLEVASIYIPPLPACRTFRPRHLWLGTRSRDLRWDPTAEVSPLPAMTTWSETVLAAENPSVTTPNVPTVSPVGPTRSRRTCAPPAGERSPWKKIWTDPKLSAKVSWRPP